MEWKIIFGYIPEMRVLIGAGNYPKLSESYIEAEIKFLLRRGIDVAVWSPKVGSPGAPDLVPVFRNHIADAVSSFQPNVFHAHYLTFDGSALEAVFSSNTPVTVRGHSFDYSQSKALSMAQKPGIKRVWLFPHFSVWAMHPKIYPLPVAYDSTLYKEASNKIRTIVYRTAAGKPGKGLEDFFAVSKLCPGFDFRLDSNHVHGDDDYLPYLEKRSLELGIRFQKDVSREESVGHMNSAGIYLDTSDSNGHPFGMPISIAEALATGCYVIAREAPGLGDYLGAAGSTYNTIEEAALLVNSTYNWDDSRWLEVKRRALQRADLFKDENVLSAETAFWNTL